VLATGEQESYELRGRGPGGTVAVYETLVAPIEEPAGQRGVCAVAVDVTAARQRELELRESQEKLQLALEATGIGLWSWDMTTNEVTWDARMRAIMGSDQPLDLARYMEEVVHPDDRELLRAGGVGNLNSGPWQAII